MKALVSIAAVIALGCGDDPINIDDGPCSIDDPCGDHAICDFTAEGGPICISATGDLDGDGLTNDKDFCQHMAGGQYDEDQDGIGDECDRCPIAPPRSTPDSDHDLVDAPCDPEPGEDGDEILLFDGFSGAGLDPDWKPTTASAWTQPGGEAIVKVDAIGTQELLSRTIIGKDAIAIQASFRVDKKEASDAQHLIGIRARDPRPAGAAAASCYSSVADVDSIERVIVETDRGSMNTVTTNAFDSANLYRAALYVSGLTAGCTMLENGDPLGVLQANVTPDQMTNVALTVRATSARFQYIIVVGH